MLNNKENAGLFLSRRSSIPRRPAAAAAAHTAVKSEANLPRTRPASCECRGSAPIRSRLQVADPARKTNARNT